MSIYSTTQVITKDMAKMKTKYWIKGEIEVAVLVGCK